MTRIWPSTRPRWCLGVAFSNQSNPWSITMMNAYPSSKTIWRGPTTKYSMLWVSKEFRNRVKTLKNMSWGPIKRTPSRILWWHLLSFKIWKMMRKMSELLRRRSRSKRRERASWTNFGLETRSKQVPGSSKVVETLARKFSHQATPRWTRQTRSRQISSFQTSSQEMTTNRLKRLCRLTSSLRTFL